MTEQSATICVIGVGAMGTALAQGANKSGYRITALSSRHPERSRHVANELGAHLTDSPAAAAEMADVIMLCVPDDAIAPVASELGDVRGKIVVHTAGSRGLAVLDVAAGRGAETGSLHPVMVVATGGRGHKALRGATAAIDGSDRAQAWLTNFAKDLGLEPVTIPASHRVLYHLSASMVGGLMTGLLASAVDLWGQLDLDRETGARAMGRMVQEAGRNLERLGVPHAVMGPAVRGDTGTIEEHLRVLAINAPQLVPLYRDLVTLCLPYAIERGMLDSQRAKSISEVLGENTGL
jgi:predicted short-subunit dehydrogenase-like oxidoreductase (DUF2520 family)